jgi:hypothetical protein
MAKSSVIRNKRKQKELKKYTEQSDAGYKKIAEDTAKAWELLNGYYNNIPVA